MTNEEAARQARVFDAAEIEEGGPNVCSTANNKQDASSFGLRHSFVIRHSSFVITPRRIFFSAGFQLFACAALVTVAEIFLKIGADQTASIPSRAAWFGYTGLLSGWVWLGILCVVGSLFSWMYVLRSVPLNIAFTLSNATHVSVPLTCWLFLHEGISGRRWLGIALVTAGLALAARPFMTLEEKL